MTGQLSPTNFRLYAAGLVLTAALASCTPIEQPTFVPVATATPTESSSVSENAQETMLEITPEVVQGGLSSLSCPGIPSTEVFLPAVPYDEEIGDCALVGRSAEVEAWLTELEQIAASCHANRASNWATALATREDLDAQIDQLQLQLPEAPQDPSDPILSEGLCPYGIAEELEDDTLRRSPRTHLYTNSLKTIGENVLKYCTMVDELVEPLWQACDEINFYQECQAPDPQQYHSIVESQMDAAQTRYDSTEFFYEQTLLTSGFADFRMFFDEDDINCSPVPQGTSLPMFTVDQNAFCRKGPGSAYDDVTAFLQGQSVQIEGRNQVEPRWWWVLVPDTSAHCWISDSTGSAEGLLEDVQVVAAPPLPEPTLACTRDLPETQCEAAGGTWKQDPNILTAVVYFCDCSE